MNKRDAAELPFSRYEGGGLVPLPIPGSADGTARHGYGLEVFKACGYACAYCGRNLARPYEAWLDLSVDHVVPGYLSTSGYPAKWIKGLSNLVTCCRACNEFTNGYRAPDHPPTTFGEFATLRDQCFRDKRDLANRRHAAERQIYARSEPISRDAS